MNDRVDCYVSAISVLVLTLLFSPSIALAEEESESITTDVSVQAENTVTSQPAFEFVDGLETILDSIEYVVVGLEAARSFSSRLSTSTTILITAFVVPGAIGYLLTERRTAAKRPDI